MRAFPQDAISDLTINLVNEFGVAELRELFREAVLFFELVGHSVRVSLVVDDLKVVDGFRQLGPVESLQLAEHRCLNGHGQMRLIPDDGQTRSEFANAATAELSNTLNRREF